MRSSSRSHGARRFLASLVLFASLGLVTVAGTEPGQSQAGRASDKKAVLPRELVGAWRLVKDDDTPGQKPPNEVITFSEDGMWRVTDVKEPFGGRCRVQGEEVLMTMLVDGNTRSHRRRFKLDAEGLHFANVQNGYAHYVRVK